MSVHKTIATFFGLGYSPKAPGTVGALGAVSLYASLFCAGMSEWVFLLLLFLIFVMGTYSSNKVEQYWGKDNGKVVIDEALGMGVSLLWIPLNWEYYVAAFGLFRLLDIWKPLGIRKMEKLEGGWGVMADDLLAGIYANLILQAVLYLSR